MILIHQYSKEIYQDKFYEVPWALSWHIFGNYRCIFKYLSQCSMYFSNKFWLCVDKEGEICVCCIYIPKTYMTLTPLIKITVVLCGRFEFIFYAMQLLHFKWISRYEKTNAYILIIYLFCINITDGSYITRYTHLYLLLLAQHLISSHWLSKTDWSRWWKETASILRKEDGIRSASWQSWRWMEGMMILQTKIETLFESWSL